MNDRKGPTEICEEHPEKTHISHEFAEEIGQHWIRREWSELQRKLFHKLSEWDNTYDNEEQCPGCRRLIINTYNAFSCSDVEDGEELPER